MTKATQYIFGSRSSFLKLFFLLVVFNCNPKGKEQIHNQTPISFPTIKKNEKLGKMVLIPFGEFQMGGTSNDGENDEFPKHLVKIKAFMMDVHEVTIIQFKTFVDETGYITIAEKSIDWEDIKMQLPKDYPKPPDDFFEPEAVVFFPTDGLVSMDNPEQWRKWVKGANWKNPEGLASNLDHRMDHPVVQLINDRSGEIEYSIRVRGKSFRPKVFERGKYTLNIQDAATRMEKSFPGIRIAKRENETLKINLV